MKGGPWNWDVVDWNWWVGCSGPFFGSQAHQHSSGPTEQGTAPQPRDLLPSPGKHGGGECLLLQGPPAREGLQPAHSVPRVLGNGHNGRAGQSRSKGSVKNLSCPAVPDGATSPRGWEEASGAPRKQFPGRSQGNLQLPAGKSGKAPQRKGRGSISAL